MTKKQPHSSNGHKTAQTIVTPICWVLGLIILLGFIMWWVTSEKTPKAPEEQKKALYGSVAKASEELIGAVSSSGATRIKQAIAGKPAERS